MAHSPGPSPAQPLHSEHIHVGRKKTPSWLWLLLPLLAIGLLALLWANRSQPPQGAAIVGNAVVGNAVVGNAVVGNEVVGDTRILTYNKKQWEVKGGAETFPAAELKLVGRSDEGDALYVHETKGYLQGAGRERVKNAISRPSGRVYLKNPDGRYQPLFERAVSR